MGFRGAGILLFSAFLAILQKDMRGKREILAGANAAPLAGAIFFRIWAKLFVARFRLLRAALTEARAAKEYHQNEERCGGDCGSIACADEKGRFCTTIRKAVPTTLPRTPFCMTVARVFRRRSARFAWHRRL